MRWRQVLLLYAVLGGLGAEYWLVERRRVEPEEAEQARPRFLPVEPAELREIRLLRDGRTVVSRRGASGWEVVEPAGAPIPPDLIAAFASALAGAEEIAHVAGAEADPRTYGLDDRAVRVEMLTERGDSVSVTIGATNPTGTAVYAQRGGTPDVVLLGRNVGYYEELLFQALSAGHVPAAEEGAPVGG